MARVASALTVACSLVVVALVVGSGGVATGAATGVKLNQMQVIGTHNSYHVEPPPDLLQILVGIDPSAIELAYSHSPIDEQLRHEGVRQLELDVYADPAGSLWRPLGTPGYKVFHIEGFDERATCETFVGCLQVVKGWSDAHPAHLPIAVLVEVKDTVDLPGPPDPLPVGPAELDALDGEIRSVFPPSRLLTPDDVRAGAPTLEQAVLAGGWPAIDDVRGRVMFLLDNKRDEYRVGHPSLEGRVAFTPSTPGQPDAAFLKINDPIGRVGEIQADVLAGYVVRTRADGPVLTPQSGSTAQRDAALESGAQWVSTDYPVPGLATRWGSDYVASIPGGTPARCNPVNAPDGCVSTDIENLPPDPVAPSTSTTAPPAPTAPGAVVPAFTG